ncbi:hypothetical protein MLD38_010711 [Melastoma candidum]|uniref:Uncharacterized protein n=1 Tax=Melastoma candidum TaxID=119954 RepID=A0ACB9R0S4_9MYRT|nr:hypothetical protein MLD38_010711 [Melastoma candidum]
MDSPYRILEIDLISANNLNDGSRFVKMDVYARVVLSSRDPKDGCQMFDTYVDRRNGDNPVWAPPSPMKFFIESSAVERICTLTLLFKLRAKCTHGDEDVGTVEIPLRELYDRAATDAGSSAPVPRPVKKPSGGPEGVLYFSYKFSEITGTRSGNMPPPPGITFPGGDPTAPPPPTGYGDPPQQQQLLEQQHPPPSRNWNHFRSGFVAGFLGGLIVWMLIGVLGSKANQYAGYDAAFAAGYKAGSANSGGFPFWHFLMISIPICVFVGRIYGFFQFF